jgi:chromosome segregation ATPase
VAIEETIANHDSRIARLEEAFQQVAMSIKQLTELAITADGRLDSAEEASVHTDARLDALIDSQIQLTQRMDSWTQRMDTLTQRVDTLTAAQLKTDEQIGAVNARFERVGEMLEQAAVSIGQLAKAIITR